MGKTTFDNPNIFVDLEERVSGSKEVIEEVYLVLRLMGSLPNIRMGRKTDYARRQNKTSYSRYTFYTNTTLQFSIHVFDFSGKCRLGFHKKGYQTEFVYFNTSEELKGYLEGWLVNL